MFNKFVVLCTQVKYLIKQAMIDYCCVFRLWIYGFAVPSFIISVSFACGFHSREQYALVW